MRETANGYDRTRLMRVLAHIDQHIETPLSIETLSRIAAFSKFHFHRQFRAAFGIGVSRYVQLVRLKRASYALAFRRHRSVTDIAMDAGFGSPDAFARAFKRMQGQTPTAFRKRPRWTPWQTVYRPVNVIRRLQMTMNFTTEQVEIKDFPEMSVAIMTHRGDPAMLGHTIRRFIDWRRQNGLRPATSDTYLVFPVDPRAIPPADFCMDLCVSTRRPVSVNADGLTDGSIPAGRCAVLRQVGASDDLEAAATFLYGQWLPASGETLRDFPLFCRKISFFPDVPEHEAVTDLYLPLR